MTDFDDLFRSLRASHAQTRDRVDQITQDVHRAQLQVYDRMNQIVQDANRTVQRAQQQAERALLGQSLILQRLWLGRRRHYRLTGVIVGVHSVHRYGPQWRVVPTAEPPLTPDCDALVELERQPGAWLRQPPQRAWLWQDRLYGETYRGPDMDLHRYP